MVYIFVFQVYFLRDPEIDYSLGGVAGALDIPGLNKVGYRTHTRERGPWALGPGHSKGEHSWVLSLRKIYPCPANE
jgi:hypothetical protein